MLMTFYAGSMLCNTFTLIITLLKRIKLIYFFLSQLDMWLGNIRKYYLFLGLCTPTKIYYACLR